MCILRQKVIIQARFVKDDGILFIIFNFIFLDPDTRKITRSLEKIKLEMINSLPST